MLKKYFAILVILPFVGLLGCVDEFVEIDTEAPAVPRGVVSLTGDQKVTISWYPNHESDLSGYNVYRSASENTGFYLISSKNRPQYVDFDVVNGQTYYYAVTAFDITGNESELSYDLVHDTPRPEGYNVRLFNYRQFPDISGYDFSEFTVQDYRTSTTDIYFEYDHQTNGFYFNAFSEDTNIQDYGFTESMDDVSYAPEIGWSQLGYVEAIVGHTYIIWTHDNHFAKIRVTGLGQDLVEIDWAYQVDPGNPELKANPRAISN